jgi:hypothetical protein
MHVAGTVCIQNNLIGLYAFLTELPNLIFGYMELQLEYSWETQRIFRTAEFSTARCEADIWTVVCHSFLEKWNVT